ncbi:MAG: amidase [Gammaproteobacteria bacterium]
MHFDEYKRLDAIALGGLLSSGQVQPSELLKAALDRLASTNPQINAVINQFPELAQKQIADLKASGGHSMIEGVPFLLKDLHQSLKGTVTTQGSRLFAADSAATFNSTLTQRYLDAGLIVFGKTNTPEFGGTVTTEPVLYGPTRNPFNPAYSAGGSSGGAAAAVAAGIVPAAHASDGGGSIRIPASCCGLFGLKPSRAGTPFGPLQGEGWNGQSINHVVSRTVRDSAYLLDLTTGGEPGDPYGVFRSENGYLNACSGDPGSLKIAVAPQGIGQTPVDPEVSAAVEKMAGICQDLGHQVEEAVPQLNVQDLTLALITVIFLELRALLLAKQDLKGKTDLPSSDEIERMTLRNAAQSESVPAHKLLHARHTMQQAGRIMGQFHLKYDIYLSPVLALPPVEIGWIDMHTEDADTYAQRLGAYTPFTGLFNQTGQPSASIPAALSEKGLPLGVMATAAIGRDDLLFALASQIERAAPWYLDYPFMQSA